MTQRAVWPPPRGNARGSQPFLTAPVLPWPPDGHQTDRPPAHPALRPADDPPPRDAPISVISCSLFGIGFWVEEAPGTLAPSGPEPHSAFRSAPERGLRRGLSIPEYVCVSGNRTPSCDLTSPAHVQGLRALPGVPGTEGRARVGCRGPTSAIQVATQTQLATPRLLTQDTTAQGLHPSALPAQPP